MGARGFCVAVAVVALAVAVAVAHADDDGERVGLEPGEREAMLASQDEGDMMTMMRMQPGGGEEDVDVLVAKKKAAVGSKKYRTPPGPNGEKPNLRHGRTEPLSPEEKEMGFPYKDLAPEMIPEHFKKYYDEFSLNFPISGRTKKFTGKLTPDAKLGRYFKRELVRLIREENENMLVRGPLPFLRKGGFAYEKLKLTVGQMNPTVPTAKMYLVVISLLNPSNEGDDLQNDRVQLFKEIAYFRRHPERGIVVNWPLLGDMKAPFNPATAFMDCVSNKDTRRHRCVERIAKHQTDELEERLRLTHRALTARSKPAGPPQLTTIVEMLKTTNASTTDHQIQELEKAMQENRPVVFYVHDVNGISRVGEFAGSFQQRYLNLTYQDAMRVCNNIVPRQGQPVSFKFKNAMQWYCFDMKSRGIAKSTKPPPLKLDEDGEPLDEEDQPKYVIPQVCWDVDDSAPPPKVDDDDDKKKKKKKTAKKEPAASSGSWWDKMVDGANDLAADATGAAKGAMG